MSKIKITSSWGNKTFFFKGKQLDKNNGGTAILKNGMSVPFVIRRSIGSIDDMGHEYQVTNYKLIALVPFNDQTVEVDLTSLDIKTITQNSKE